MNSKIWHTSKKPVPRTAAQMIPVDPQGKMLIMHRAEGLRSASNVWSFPSGLHEVGEKLQDCVCRELYEEYELKLNRMSPIGVYENVAGDQPDRPQWHWVILLYAVQVKDVTTAVNKEPEKHDVMRFIDIDDILKDSFLSDYLFHSSFSHFVRDNREHLVLKLKEASGWAIRE